MPSATIDNREGLIEEYVQVTALETLVNRLASRVYGPAGIDVPWEPLIYGDLSPKEHTFSLLWPRDEDLKTPEHQLAAIRSDILAAQLCFTLADASEQLLKEAVHLAGLADRDARELMAKSGREA